MLLFGRECQTGNHGADTATKCHCKPATKPDHVRQEAGGMAVPGRSLSMTRPFQRLGDNPLPDDLLAPFEMCGGFWSCRLRGDDAEEGFTGFAFRANQQLHIWVMSFITLVDTCLFTAMVLRPITAPGSVPATGLAVVLDAGMLAARIAVASLDDRVARSIGSTTYLVYAFATLILYQSVGGIHSDLFADPTFFALAAVGGVLIGGFSTLPHTLGT